MSDRRPEFMVAYLLAQPGDASGKPMSLVKGESVLEIGRQVARFLDVPLNRVLLKPALEAPIEDVQRLTALLVAEWTLAQFAMIQDMTRAVQPARGLIS